MTTKYFSGNWHSFLEFNVTTSLQDRVANLSVAKVTVSIGFEQNWSIEFGNTYGAYVGLQMAGQTRYLNFGELFLDGAKKNLGTVEFTVSHDEDGNATRTLNVWTGSTDGITYNNLYLGSVNTSQDIPFERIPRMSTVKTVDGSRILGSEHTIQLDRKVESFTHQVWYRIWGSDWIDLGKGHGTTVKFTPNLEEARRNINVSVSTFDISVRTFDGDKQIGRDEYSNGWSIQLPPNVKPKLQTVELTDKAKSTKDIVGKNTFVQTFSEMVCQFQGMEGTYGSTIKNFYAEVVGQNMSITSNGATFPFFKNYGDFQVQAYVIDSRGLKSNVVTIPIKVLQYFAPILSFEAVRGGGDQQTIVVRRTARIAPLMVDGIQKNPMRLKFKVKPANEGYFTENKGGGIDSRVINSITNSNADLFGTFSADKAWIVEGTISDAYASFTFTAPIVGPEELVQCRTPKGTGFGKVWERGSIDAKGDIYSHNELVQVGRLTQINGKSIKLTGSANNAMKTGLYYAHDMTELPEGLQPSQKYGYLQVNTHPEIDNLAMQIYVPRNTDTMYMRRKIDTGWHPWVQFNPNGSVVDSKWNNATFRNNWRAAGDSVQYSKTSDGLVCIRGVATGGSIAENAAIINLPAGYRPSRYIYKKALNNSYGTAILGINTNGDVTVKKNVDNNWLCLDDISFKI